MLCPARGLVLVAAVIAGAIAASAGCRPAETFRSGDAGIGFGSGGQGGAGGLPIGVGSGGTGGGGAGGEGGEGTGGVSGSGGSGGGSGGVGGSGGGGGTGGTPPAVGGSGGQRDAAGDPVADAGVDRGRDAGMEAPRDLRPEPPADVAPERPADVGREVMDTGPTVNGCLRVYWTLTVNNICDTIDCPSLPPNRKDPAGAIDGDPDTRYTTGRLQGSSLNDEMAAVDFGDTVTISGVRLTTDFGDGPAEYRVEYSTNGTLWRRFVPDVAGVGADILIIPFPATAMRAVRVIQIGSKTTNWWSIHELTLTNCVN